MMKFSPTLQKSEGRAIKRIERDDHIRMPTKGFVRNSEKNIPVRFLNPLDKKHSDFGIQMSGPVVYIFHSEKLNSKSVKFDSEPFFG